MGFGVGKKNPSWKGGDVKYGSLHDYVKSKKLAPKYCDECGEDKPLDLANISGEYKRDLDDWRYICRKCHMNEDGRSEGLRQSGRSRRIPNKDCVQCGKSFHRTSGMHTAKYCSHKCYGLSKRKTT